MNSIINTIKKFTFIALLVLALSAHLTVYAAESDTLLNPVDDSMYKYNALENKTPVLSLLNTDKITPEMTEDTTIDNQPRLLEEEPTKVENFTSKPEKKFNLFGWLVNIF